MNTPSSGNQHFNHQEDNCCCGHRHHHEEHNCSCGHEHHHEEHSCSCGHEHHHEEHSCSCGHEHHHEEHGCSCGHDHHHEEHAHAPDDGLEKRIYILENLGCANCAAKMEEKIRMLPGISHASITFATKQLRVSAAGFDGLLPQIQEICASIESQVQVIEKDSSPAAPKSDSAKQAADQKDLTQIIAGAILFILGLVLSETGASVWMVLAVYIIGYLILGGRILLEAAQNIRRGYVFDETFLMSIATLGAFAIREYPEAMGVMLFYRVGEYFEHKAVEKSRSQIMDAVDMRPEVVNLIEGEAVRVIPAGEARVGDLLLIRPGDRIPLDGVVVEGESRLDTSPITGEPVPVSIHSGDQATSGCVNTSGQLKLRVEKPLAESMVTRILNSVENAAASKPKIDRFITRFARIYTPCVVGVALATAILPSLVTGNWNYWVYTALSFLVMSCPCALVLSVPLAFFSGIGAGSRKGILFKGGAAIEAMSRLCAVVLDKTGTITQGNFKLQKIISTGNYNENDLLHLCASCEQNSTHPIAHSILSAAREKGISVKLPLSMSEIAAHGVEAVLEKGEVLCGNRKLMQMHGVDLSAAANCHGGAEVFIAVDGRLEGILVISDTVKADAKSAIARLKGMNLRTVMLTGDSETSARAVAAETGIDQVHARLLPQDKLEQLARIRAQHGAVMFVGDGINDAPVLAGADVGAAMGNGADAAIEAADTVFMTGSVEAIPQAIRIARSANRIAIENVVFALAIKIAVMILALCGFANMWLAVFADTGVAMLCVINSIRILYRK